MTMNIAKVKIDKQGRITLPDKFLKGNDIDTDAWVLIKPVYNDSNACKLTFNNKDYYCQRQGKVVTDGLEKDNG